MDHAVRTAFGVSLATYGFDPTRLPPQGILQGNGAGPAGWFAMRSDLLHIMEADGFGYCEWTLICRHALCIISSAFVDDNDLVHSNNSPGVSTDSLIDKAQAMISRWNGLLCVTGGDLAPEKSHWYLVELFWKNGHWQYKTVDDSPGELWLPGSLSPIEQREVSQPAEALGILSCPDGNMSDKVSHLQSKVSLWTENVRNRRIAPEVAWYCLNSTIMRTIEYPLVATTFSCCDIS